MKNLIATTVCALALVSAANAKDIEIWNGAKFDKSKTPVLCVHGLWGDVLKGSWDQMIPELLKDPAIAKKYQFMTVEYDTSVPFWRGANEVRAAMDKFRKEHPKAKKFILVGHSMGGLISHQLMTDYGGKHRSDVQRGIFICGPHKGSPWGRLAFTPAVAALSAGHKVYELLNACPIISGPFHTIVSKWDELVSINSARLDGAKSEKRVDDMHLTNSRTAGIAEVARILKSEKIA